MARKNLVDKVVSFFNPQAGARRLQYRKLEELVGSNKRKYDGASRTDRTSGWVTSSASANSELNNVLFLLRNRSRDLVRNDPYASKAKQAITSNVVGTGISLKISGKSSGRVSAAQAAWKLWAESNQCDYDRRHDIYGLQATAFDCIFESGEVLIRRIRARSSDNLAVPLQLQILEPDYIDSLRNGTNGAAAGGYILQGIEFDANHRRVAYWLYNRHPGDFAFVAQTGLVSQRVPASELIHIFRTDRPGQMRGVPWLAPVMVKIRDFNDYEDAQLLRQKIAACFSVFVRDIEPGVDPTGTPDPLSEKVGPGLIEILPPGKEVSFANPPGVNGYGDYSKQVLRGVAAGIGISYEALTGDLSNVNFSSGRMGWLEFGRNIDSWRWKMFIPTGLDGIWGWFAEAASLAGLAMDGLTPSWTPPARAQIDPIKETAATIQAIRGGLKTLPEAIREQGFDPKVHLEEIAESFKELDRLGLTLDCDPRKITKAGSSQPLTEDGNDG